MSVFKKVLAISKTGNLSLTDDKKVDQFREAIHKLLFAEDVKESVQSVLEKVFGLAQAIATIEEQNGVLKSFGYSHVMPELREWFLSRPFGQQWGFCFTQLPCMKNMDPEYKKQFEALLAENAEKIWGVATLKDLNKLKSSLPSNSPQSDVLKKLQEKLFEEITLLTSHPRPRLDSKLPLFKLNMGREERFSYCAHASKPSFEKQTIEVQFAVEINKRLNEYFPEPCRRFTADQIKDFSRTIAQALLKNRSNYALVTNTGSSHMQIKLKGWLFPGANASENDRQKSWELICQLAGIANDLRPSTAPEKVPSGSFFETARSATSAPLSTAKQHEPLAEVKEDSQSVISETINLEKALNTLQKSFEKIRENGLHQSLKNDPKKTVLDLLYKADGAGFRHIVTAALDSNVSLGIYSKIKNEANYPKEGGSALKNEVESLAAITCKLLKATLHEIDIKLAKQYLKDDEAQGGTGESLKVLQSALSEARCFGLKVSFEKSKEALNTCIQNELDKARQKEESEMERAIQLKFIQALSIKPTPTDSINSTQELKALPQKQESSQTTQKNRRWPLAMVMLIAMVLLRELLCNSDEFSSILPVVCVPILSGLGQNQESQLIEIVSFSDGLVEEGTRKNGVLVKGKRISSSETIEGEFDEEGSLVKGKVTFPSGNVWSGCFKGGYLEGRGKKIFANGVIHVGTFRGGNLVYGKIIYPDKGSYKGWVENGLPHGEGVRKSKTGETQIGTFVRDEFIEGRSIRLNGEEYHGTFRNGLLEGEGVWVQANGMQLKGVFSKGVLIDGIITALPAWSFTGKVTVGIVQNAVLIETRLL